MKEPNWLPKEAILAIHDSLLSRFGGSRGIRDMGLVDSALNRPLHLFHYEDPTLFDLAAAYTSGIVMNHPFLDGNKRTGFIAGYTFLGINGKKLTISEEEAALEIIALADSRVTDQELTDWFAFACLER